MAARRAALGLPRRRSSRPWSALEDVLLREAARAGLPATAVARRLGRPAEQVRNRRRHLVSRRPPLDRGRRAAQRVGVGWACRCTGPTTCAQLGRVAPARRAARTPSPGAATTLVSRGGRRRARRIRQRCHVRADRRRADATDDDRGRGAGSVASCDAVPWTTPRDCSTGPTTPSPPLAASRATNWALALTPSSKPFQRRADAGRASGTAHRGSGPRRADARTEAPGGRPSTRSSAPVRSRRLAAQ